MKLRDKKSGGFTLIELMIVVAIVAILAAIAYPSYMDSVRKGRRSDGIAALSALQQAQQRLRSNCRFYGLRHDSNTTCGANAAGTTVAVSSTSSDGYYNIAIAGNSTTGYTATATGQGDQVNDSEAGTSCATLTLTVNAANPNGSRTPADCW